MLPIRQLCPRVLTALACALVAAASALGQRDAPDLFAEKTPLERWVQEGPRTEVPWKVHLLPAKLSIHQRLLARVEAQVNGIELAKRRGEGHLIALVQFKDRQGHVYQDYAMLPLNDVQPGAQHTVMSINWEAFALPGAYEVTLALYDTVSGEHNLAQQQLRIAPLKHDPLRDAWRDLPNVELFQVTEGFDQFFRPEITGRLHLPLKTRRPVQIELLANLPTSGRRRHNMNLAWLLPILKTFSQIEVENGSLGVVALDVTRRHVRFEQSNVKELDWDGLKAALEAVDPGVIGVKELQGSKENAAFLREELARRIEARTGPQGEGGDPLRVFILIGSPMAFRSDSHEHPLPSSEHCDCRMYYVRYQPQVMLQEVDLIAGMLKPLKVRVLSVDSAESLRKALATLLTELSQI